MLLRTIGGVHVPAPLRATRVLIEDPQILHADVSGLCGPFAVTVCSGPEAGEVCPLVVDGRCPQADHDIVVTALGPPWARSVHAAWTAAGMPVVDARDVAASDPIARTISHIGAVVQRIWAPGGRDRLL